MRASRTSCDRRQQSPRAAAEDTGLDCLQVHHSDCTQLQLGGGSSGGRQLHSCLPRLHQPHRLELQRWIHAGMLPLSCVDSFHHKVVCYTRLHTAHASVVRGCITRVYIESHALQTCCFASMLLYASMQVADHNVVNKRQALHSDSNSRHSTNIRRTCLLSVG